MEQNIAELVGLGLFALKAYLGLVAIVIVVVIVAIAWTLISVIRGLR